MNFCKDCKHSLMYNSHYGLVAMCKETPSGIDKDPVRDYNREYEHCEDVRRAKMGNPNYPICRMWEPNKRTIIKQWFRGKNNE